MEIKNSTPIAFKGAIKIARTEDTSKIVSKFLAKHEDNYQLAADLQRNVVSYNFLDDPKLEKGLLALLKRKSIQIIGRLSEAKVSEEAFKEFAYKK